MKKLFNLMLAATCAIAMVGCSDDDEPKQEETPSQPAVAEGVFVLNQGVYTNQIEGSLTVIDYESATATQSAFQKANGRSLGSTPQGGVVYGTKAYLCIYESNVIEIIDTRTYKSLKQISLANAEGQSPRAAVAHDGKVYISMYNGYVSRLDTATMAIDKTVKVGPNPEIMAVRGNYLYVPSSDGMNWQSGYGTTASKINLKTFAVDDTFTVGLNPCEFASNGTDLFLLCKGNYGDIPSMIYRIDEQDKSSEIAEATLLTVSGNKLYYIYAPYWATESTYTVYDIATGRTSDMLKDKGVDSPAGIGVDPRNGNIVITSYSLEGGYTSYTTDGYAKVYDSNGNPISRYDVGVGPCAIFFK